MAYFPPLDKCLSGKEPLIPWTAVLDEISSDSEGPSSLELQTFLSNDEVIDILVHAVQPFAKNNDKSKHDFETRTAPIQVSGPSDIEGFKNDSVWLVKELGINETAALRLVITEHQLRPADLLLGRVLDETSAKKQEKKESGTALSDVVRHRRLLQIYLQESSALKQLAALLVSLGINDVTPARVDDLWLLSVAGKVRDGQLRAAQGKSAIYHTIKDFERLLGLLGDQQSWPHCFKTDFVLHADFTIAVLQDMISNLRQCIVLHSQSPLADAEIVLLWYNMMDSVRFFEELSPSTQYQAELSNLLQALASVFSAALLDVSQTIAEIDQVAAQSNGGVSYPRLKTAYINDDNCLRDLNLILFNASQDVQVVVPAIYAWAIITTYLRDVASIEHEAALQIEDNDSGRHGSVTRRQSALEQKYDVLQDRALGSARDDPAQHFARQAVDQLGVYDFVSNLSRIISSSYSAPLELPLVRISRSYLFDIWRESLPMVAYDGHIVESVLALLAPESEGLLTTAPQALLGSKFWHDRLKCTPLLFQQAVQRFPYEVSPLLRLLSALLSNLAHATDDWTAVVASLESLSTITITLPEGFRGYTLEHEEEGANAMRLTETLAIFSENAALQSFSVNDADSLAMQRPELVSALRIPAETHGTILKDSRPFIISLQHSFSGLNYIGLLLTTILPNARYTLAAPAPAIDNTAAADILQLIVNILKGASDRSSAQHVLDELSANIPGQLDIIAVVTELHELELLARAEQTSQPGSTDILIQCLKFLQVVSEHLPERLWAYLAQSTLFGNNNGSSPLLMPSSQAEDQSKLSRLLYESMRLYQIATDDALHGLVKRSRTTKPRSGSRFDSPMDSLGDISERVITQVLSTYTSLALEVLQGLMTRTDVYFHFRAEILDCIARTLNRLLLSVYGIGSAASSSVLTVLAAPAKLVVSALAPEEAENQPVSALLATLLPLLHTDTRVLKAGVKTLAAQQTQSTLQLAVLLLRTTKVLKRTTTHLTTSLISSMPILTPIYALQAQFRRAISDLLLEVISAIDTGDSDPVSIFSQIEPQQGTHFLNLLTNVDSSLIDTATECCTWDLFASACRHSQQWFAMYLVTGVLPKDQIKDKPKVDRTALSYALDMLSDIKNLNPERATAILGFVAEAQKTWSWATSIVRAHYSFKEQALTWLSSLTAPSLRANTADQLLAAREYRLASQLCDVLAVNVHASVELGDKKFCKDVLGKLSFLTKHAAAVDGYNLNLHKTLNENISRRFTGLTLTDLKRTSVNPGLTGSDHMYDTGMAGILLAHDESWQGGSRAQSQGFLDELTRANVNWSLYDAQIKLLQEWATLIITLANSDESDAELSTILQDTVENCLIASVEANLDLPDAATQLQTRAELAFTLLSKLARSKVDQSRAKRLLYAAWTLVKQSPVDFVVAEAQQDLSYYRTLLQILFLTLRLSASSQPASASTSGADVVAKLDLQYESVLIDVMRKTITSGFRALCGNLHDSTDRAQPQDFALLIALAKAVLSGSSSKPFYAQIADAVAFSGAVRSATSLFSWSDRLADLTSDDPVYGELAIMFLTTVSRVPQVAELMATENILVQLSSANLANYFRKPEGRGPFDSPARMYVIWTDGFLPLCLNLINALGGPIVGEVSSFVGSFEKQLLRAQDALQNAAPSARNPRAGAITLSMVTEARDLITLAQIIESAKQLGAAEGISADDITNMEYDVKKVAEDLEASTKSSRSLRDRVTPVTPGEVVLYQSSADGSDNGLQATVAREINYALSLVNG